MADEKSPSRISQRLFATSRSEMRIRMSTDKKKQAIALEYDPVDDAPRVLASGTGVLAEKIIEKAKEANVPIHRDDKLADTLSRLEIGEMIPPELYEVVAEILVFVDGMDKLRAKMERGGKQPAYEGRRL